MLVDGWVSEWRNKPGFLLLPLPNPLLPPQEQKAWPVYPYAVSTLKRCLRPKGPRYTSLLNLKDLYHLLYRMTLDFGSPGLAQEDQNLPPTLRFTKRAGVSHSLSRSPNVVICETWDSLFLSQEYEVEWFLGLKPRKIKNHCHSKPFT